MHLDISKTILGETRSNVDCQVVTHLSLGAFWWSVSGRHSCWISPLSQSCFTFFACGTPTGSITEVLRIKQARLVMYLLCIWIFQKLFLVRLGLTFTVKLPLTCPSGHSGGVCLDGIPVGNPSSAEAALHFSRVVQL